MTDGTTTHAAASGFSPDYVTARARFRTAAESSGFELRSYPIGQRGPSGDELTIDVALAGSDASPSALVVSSGLHGIEGFFGSAVQCMWLERRMWAEHRPSDEPARPPAHRVVLIHALNPYGFAWRRRVNEGGVDLNRNFLLEGQPYEGAAQAYRDLDTLLNPESPPSALDPFLLKAAIAIAKSGFTALKNAVAQGQYEYPRGLFYGGAAPSATAHILRAQLPTWIGSAERVLHLDFHTGRGAWGTHVLGIDLPTDGARFAALRATFGTSIVEGLDPRGVLYEMRGGLGAWLEQLLPNVRYDALLAEFGTYSALKVLALLRAENRAHHYAADDARLVERTKQALFEAFCPRDPTWREASTAAALALIGKALAALAHR